MEKLFLAVLNMSVTASAVIVLVLLARLALRKAPRVFSYALWAVVLFKLLCPISIESSFALLPSYPDVQSVSRSETDNGGAVSPTRQETVLIPAAADWTLAASGLWLSGVMVLLGYGVWSTARLRRKLAVCVRLEGESGVLMADHIPSPFVLGLLSPKIYLPSGLPENERDYILLHERTHIRRMDHISRLLAWLALAVHWFNPLVWLAFCLAGKDMEMSCDESVLRGMDRDIRADYSSSLLRLSVGGKLPAGPLAFGGGDLKRRIKSVLSYKKPAPWVPVLALAAVLAVGVGLAADTGGQIDPDSITSYTQIPATTSVTPRHTFVYTAAARRQDLLAPTEAIEVRKEDGDELVRLLNSYSKTVYGRGDLDLNGIEHHLFRLSRADGGYYLVDFWYWNGFSFNPLHAGGEDSYTTLVTRYDAAGNAGITWQMSYYFDRAFKDWWHSI